MRPSIILRYLDHLAILDDQSFLLSLGAGHVDGSEHVHAGHFGELECIVAIRLAFGVLPGPGLIVGAANDGLESFGSADVVDPTRGSAGFHHDQVRCDVAEGAIGIREHRIDVRSLGGDGLEAVLASLGVVEATDGVELAKVH